ncbi:hypothetical protein ASE61_02035 [Bosea sp. Root670]|nr:hypothetical protein ASE61_02035 [Bosea sp. Root670]
MQIVKVSNTDVREYSDRVAGIFNRIASAERDEQPLISPVCPACDFAVIDGVTYRIDVTQTSRYGADGQRIAPEAHRILDLAHGAGKWPAGLKAEPIRGEFEDFAKYRLRSRPRYIGVEL